MSISNLTTEDFAAGMKVRYVPHYAKGDLTHKHIQNGIVSSVNDKWVFVRYIINDVFQETAQATHPKDLIID